MTVVTLPSFKNPVRSRVALSDYARGCHALVGMVVSRLAGLCALASRSLRYATVRRRHAVTIRSLPSTEEYAWRQAYLLCASNASASVWCNSAGLARLQTGRNLTCRGESGQAEDMNFNRSPHPPRPPLPRRSIPPRMTTSSPSSPARRAESERRQRGAGGGRWGGRTSSNGACAITGTSIFLSTFSDNGNRTSRPPYESVLM